MKKALTVGKALLSAVTALMTFGAFAADEKLVFTLLPPSPHKKSDVIGSVDYKIFRVSGKEERVEKMFSSIPVGDCANCSRGIALNCDVSSSGSLCREGIGNGIGFRFELNGKDSQALAVRVKNASKYTVAAVGRPGPIPFALGEEGPLTLVVAKNRHSVFKIELSYKPAASDHRPMQLLNAFR